MSADFLLFGEHDDEEILLRADGDADEVVDLAREVVRDIEFVQALLG